MEVKQPNNCPVCKNKFTITKMTCNNCHTELTGSFAQCKYCSLDERVSAFLETFLKCRGNIKEIEKELSISYPTVKNLTEEMLAALGFTPINENEPQSEDILGMVERGEITADEAAKLIKRARGKF
ncbi:MAG: hypothetical protein A2Y17_02520 [Clostridiales bacterium GWF2_38_85]|nr:MAG: hypothetical protein A2Y17_02520 [Clostridiales bacterium GWF2_38_85]HBL85072.1 hypothetical protein [Clostridiales bacterium]